MEFPDDAVAETLNNKKLGNSRTRLRMHDYDYDYVRIIMTRMALDTVTVLLADITTDAMQGFLAAGWFGSCVHAFLLCCAWPGFVAAPCSPLTLSHARAFTTGTCALSISGGVCRHSRAHVRARSCRQQGRSSMRRPDVLAATPVELLYNRSFTNANTSLCRSNQHSTGRIMSPRAQALLTG